MIYEIKLNNNELQYILNCLAEKPYKVVKPLMESIEAQILVQNEKEKIEENNPPTPL